MKIRTTISAGLVLAMAMAFSAYAITDPGAPYNPPAVGGGSLESYLKNTANNVGVPTSLVINGSVLYNVTGYTVSLGDGSVFGAGWREPVTYFPMLALELPLNYSAANYAGYNVIVNISTTHGNYSVNKIVPVWIAGDANGDKSVNILDTALIGLHWGAKAGTADYHDGADLNNDGIINVLDSAIVGLNWGNHV